jgi:hypothetical protein
MKKRWIYIFSKIKNSGLRISVIISILIFIVILAVLISPNIINNDVELIEKRNEVDPRKLESIDYKSISNIENNEGNNFITYFENENKIHFRNENDLSYGSILKENISDFSVNNNKSIVLTENNSVYISDEMLKNNIFQLIKNKDKGPEKLTNKVYQYGNEIIMFDGKIYSYNINLNSWTNISKKYGLKDYTDIKFFDDYFLVYDDKSFHYFTIPDYDFFSYDFSEKIKDITYFEDNLIFLLENTIELVNLKEKTINNVFRDSNFIGENIKGIRFLDNYLYLLTEKGLNYYDFSMRYWKFIETEEEAKDFYLKDDFIYLVHSNNISVYESFSLKNNFSYNKFYYFDSKDFYYLNEKGINKINNDESSIVLKSPTGSFKNFNPDLISDFYYVDGYIVITTSEQRLFYYNIKNKKYSMVEGIVENIVFNNKKFFYIKNNDLFSFDLFLEKKLSASVVDFDVYKNSISYIKSDNTLHITELNGGQTKSFFDPNMDFNLKNLVYSTLYNNRLFLVNKDEYAILDIDTMKYIEKNGFEKDEVKDWKRFSNENFSIFTNKMIYFFDLPNNTVSEFNLEKYKIESKSGDYITLINKSESLKEYIFLDSKGEKTYKTIQRKPFSFEEVRQYFALNTKIIAFILNNNEVYYFNYDKLEYEKRPIEYSDKIKNIQFINDKVYAISNGNLYDFENKTLVEKDIKDYFYKDKFFFLSTKGYIFDEEDNRYFDIKDDISGDVLFAKKINNNFIAIKDNKILVLDLITYNTSSKELNGVIKDVAYNSNFINIITSKNKLYSYNIITSELSEINYSFDIDSYNTMNDGFSLKSSNSFYLFQDSNISEIYNSRFEIIDQTKANKIKNIYIDNNLLYFIGNNFYAIYNINSMKWEKYETLNIENSNYIDNKVYIKSENKTYYFDKTNLINDFRTEFENYAQYENMFVNINQDIKNIQGLTTNGKILIAAVDDRIISYDLEKRAWKKEIEFGSINKVFSEDDQLIIFINNAIYRYYIEDNSIKKNNLKINYDDFNYDDYIVLKDGNSYTALDKSLTKIDNMDIKSLDFSSVKDLYYINGNIVLINEKEISIIDGVNENHYEFDNLKYKYIDNKMYIIADKNLYYLSSDKLNRIENNVRDFSVITRSSSDELILLDTNNNIKKSTENIINYQLNNEIAYYAKFNSNLLLLDEKSNLYLYNLKTHNIDKSFVVNDDLKEFLIRKDRKNNELFLTWKTNENFYWIGLDKDNFSVNSISNDYIDYIFYNDEVYFFNSNEVYKYFKNGRTKILNAPNLVDNKEIEFIYEYQEIYYVKTKYDTYALNKKNNSFEKSKNLFDKKYIYNGIEILQKNDEIYSEKNISNKEFEKNNIFNYENNDYLFSSKTNELLDKNNLTNRFIDEFKIFNNFIYFIEEEEFFHSSGIKDFSDIQSVNIFDKNINKNKNELKIGLTPNNEAKGIITNLEKDIVDLEESIDLITKKNDFYNNLIKDDFNLSDKLPEYINDDESSIANIYINTVRAIEQSTSTINNYQVKLEESLIQKGEIIKQIKDLNTKIENIELSFLDKVFGLFKNEDKLKKQKVESLSSELDNLKARQYDIEKTIDETNLLLETEKENFEKLNKDKATYISKIKEKTDEETKIKKELNDELENKIIELKNLHKVKPDLFIQTNDFIYKEEFLNPNLSKEMYYYTKELEFKHLLTYILEQGYPSKNVSIFGNTMTVNDNDEKMKISDNYNKKYFRSNNYFILDDTIYTNGKSLKFKNIYDYKDDLLIISESNHLYSYTTKLSEINSKNTGAIYFNYSGIKYNNEKLGLYKNNTKITKNGFFEAIYYSNNLYFKGNYYTYNLSGEHEYLSNSESYNQKINKYFTYTIDKSIDILNSNYENKKLQLINNKIFWDYTEAISNDSLNHYAYIENIGFLNLNTMNYIPFKEKANIFESYSEGAYFLSDEQYYSLSNNDISQITPSNIEVYNQSISYNDRITSIDSKTSIHEKKFIKIQDDKLALDKFYSEGYFIYQKPDSYTYKKDFIFEKEGFVYQFDNYFPSLAPKNLKNIVNINGILYNKNNLSSKNIPDYYLNKKLVIDQKNNNIFSESFDRNSIFLNNTELKNTDFENIKKIFQIDENKIYIMTNNFIYGYNKNTNNLIILKNIESYVESKWFYDKILVEDGSKKYYLQNNNIFDYDQKILSINLQDNKMQLSDNFIEINGMIFGISDFNLEKDIFGLLKLKSVLNKENKNIFFTEDNFILENTSNIKIYKSNAEFKNIELHENKILINKSYQYNNSKLSKISKDEQINLIPIEDLYFNSDGLNFIHSENYSFDKFIFGEKTNYKYIFFENIINISDKSGIKLFTNNGIFDFIMSSNNNINRFFDDSIESSDKYFKDVFFSSNGINYLYSDQLIKKENDLFPSVLIDKDHLLKNILSEQNSIYLSINSENINIFNDSFFDFHYLPNSIYSYYDNKLYIKTPSTSFIEFENTIDDFFTHNKEKVLKFDNSYFNLKNNSLEEIDLSNYFKTYRVFYDGTFKKELNDKSDLTIDSKKLSNLNEIKPKKVLLNDQSSYLISNELGIFKEVYESIFSSNPILNKKRIEEKLIYDTEKENYSIGFKSENNSLINSVVYENNNFTNHYTYKKPVLIFDSLTFDEIYDSGIFDFDKYKNFAVNTNKFYINSGNYIWKISDNTNLFNKNAHDYFYVKEDQIITDDNKIELEKLSSSKIKINISENLEIEQKLSEGKEMISIQNISSPIKENRLIFDIPNKIVFFDKLWFVNNEGYFSKDKIIKNNNLSLVKDLYSEYIFKNDEKYIIKNDDLIEYDSKDIIIEDNKWKWHISNNSISFNNKYNEDLKRVYNNGYFSDDIVTKVKIYEGIIYLFTKNEINILYDQNYNPYTMNLDEINYNDFKKNKNSIIFESEEYQYQLSNGDNFINVTKK